MQSVSSSIWTRVTVTISYDDNHYMTAHPLAKLQILLITNRFMPFSKELVQSKTQRTLSRIWIWVDNFILFDHKHFSTSSSEFTNKRYHVLAWEGFCYGIIGSVVWGFLFEIENKTTLQWSNKYDKKEILRPPEKFHEGVVLVNISEYVHTQKKKDWYYTKSNDYLLDYLKFLKSN